MRTGKSDGVVVGMTSCEHKQEVPKDPCSDQSSEGPTSMNGIPEAVVTAQGSERRVTLTPREWVEEFQRKIGAAAKAEPKRRFYTLIDKVFHPHILRVAWETVRKNKGAPGIDGRSIEQIEQEGVDKFLQELHEQLRTSTYRVRGVKRVFIPKPDGRQRPLGIPTVADRVVQAAIKLVLEPIFEADFEDCSFGFRPGRSTDMARQRIYKLLNWGCTNVVETDIEAFFDTIPHDRLMKAVERRIADGKILVMIRAWLKASIHDCKGISTPAAGTPQGGVLSPLLANIYLDQLDKAWKARGMEDRAGADAKLVRYADDAVILTSKDPQECLGAMREIAEGLGLKLKESKTRVVNSYETGFNFLGFRFRRRRLGPGGKGYTVMTPTPEATQRILNNVRASLWNKAVSMKEVRTTIERVINSKLRGWANYYRHTNASRFFQKVQRGTEQVIRKYLRRRRQRSGYGYREYPSEYLYKRLGLYDVRKTGITYVGGL